MVYVTPFTLHPFTRSLADDDITFLDAVDDLVAVVGLDAELDRRAALAVALADDHEAAAFKGPDGFGRQPQHIFLAFEHNANLRHRAGRQRLALRIGDLEAGGAVLLAHGAAAA